jgi:hypothetical protein
MLRREGVERGRHVLDGHKIKDLLADEAVARKVAAVNSKWILEGMEGPRK